MGGRNGAHGPRSGGRPRKEPPPRSRFTVWVEEWLAADPSRTMTDLAREIGASPSAVYNLRSGYFTPGLRLACAIARASNGQVPAESWDE